MISCKEKGNTANITKEVPTYNFEEFQRMLPNDEEKIYVVNFWATWCAPCVEELPLFSQLEHENDKVEVILVSLDMPKMKETQLLPFIQKNEITSHVILLDDPNSNAWIPKIDPHWDGAIPATLIYTNKNKMFYSRKFEDFEDLLDEVKKMKN